MGSLLAYSGLTTKIRAMQSKLITNAQYEEISNLESVQELFAYLQKHPGYEHSFAGKDPATVHRGDIEVLLRFDTFRDFSKIYNFANHKQRQYLKLYFMKYEVEVLKRYLRNIFDSREDNTYMVNVNDFELHSSIRTEVVSQSQTIEEFVQNLKDTIYYEPLSKLSHLDNLTLFDYEMCLDLFLYTTIWKSKNKYFKGQELEIITHSYGRKIDMLNIAWIYRAKKYYNIDNKEIYSFLIPVNYKLKKDETIALVESEDMETYFKVLQDSHYGRYLNLNKDSLENMSLEQTEEAVLTRVHVKDYEHEPYSIATINTYLYLKEREISKLVTATECIRYGYPAKEIYRQLTI